MLTNKYFASYYPVKSLIHKLNPVIKLICLFLLLVTTLFSDNLKLTLFIAFICLYLLYVSKVPLRFYFDSLYSIRYIFILFIFLLAAKGLYLNEAVMVLLKIITVIIYLSMIFYTTTPTELKYGLEKILAPFNILKLNLSGFINTLVNIITFFPLLFITEREVVTNASERGLDYFHSDILSKLLVVVLTFKNTLRLTIEKIKNNKLTSTLRGYSTFKYRTNYSTNRIGFFDILLLLIHLLFTIYFVWEMFL